MNKPVQIFARTWWAKDGETPQVGRKSIIKYVDTVDEAIKFCTDFNDGYNTRTKEQIRRGYKYEWTQHY